MSTISSTQHVTATGTAPASKAHHSNLVGRLPSRRRSRSKAKPVTAHTSGLKQSRNHQNSGVPFHPSLECDPVTDHAYIAANQAAEQTAVATESTDGDI